MKLLPHFLALLALSFVCASCENWEEKKKEHQIKEEIKEQEEKGQAPKALDKAAEAPKEAKPTKS